MSFFAELKRRNVFRAAIAYLAAAWLLIQIVETLVPIFRMPDDYTRWATLVLIIGLIPALVFAWVFEITPDGLKKEHQVDRSDSITRQTGRNLDSAIMVVLSMAITYFALDKYVFDPGRDAAALDHARKTAVIEALETAAASAPAHNTIAVLPFVDLSPQADRGYFADGIAEELLNLLARVPELRVVARTSSFSFKNQEASIATIAESLHVAHILEGSVRTDGDQLRITVQLIETDSGYHLWSQNFDRPMQGIFDLQDEVARNVVGNLKLKILGNLPKSAVTDPEAYRLFMLARDRAREQSRESLEEALDLFEQVIEIDPTYARAWDERALAWSNATANGLRPWPSGYDEALASARKAIEIEPDLAIAYSHIGTIIIKYKGELSEAAQYFGRSLELAPNDPLVRRNAALLLLVLGRHDEAAAISEYAAQFDPLSTHVIEGAGLSYTFGDRLDEAEASFRKLLQISPNYIGAQYHLGKALLLKGDATAALEAFENELDDEYRTKGRALAQHALGNKIESDAALKELIDTWGERWPAEVAQVYAFRGELDQAFEWMDREIDLSGLGGFGEGRWMRLFDNLRSDERWQDLLKRTKMSEEHLAAVQFEIPALP